MRSVVRVGVAVVAFAALAAWLGAGPARAKDYPNGYDPQSGWSWDEDFRYNSATNPFGLRGPDWAAWQGYTPSSGYYVPYSPTPMGYYYGTTYPAYNAGSYSYGAYAAQPARDNLARVRVMVPADAKVWFDGQATKQTGADRRFESPALKPGHSYSYDVKAQWRDKNGKEVTRTRHVDVSANANVTVDFMRD